MQQVAELTARLDKTKTQETVPPITATIPPREAPSRRKRDLHHHHGRKRQESTHIETLAYDHCPDGSRPLTGGNVTRTRQVIELTEPQPIEVVEHQF